MPPSPPFDSPLACAFPFALAFPFPFRSRFHLPRGSSGRPWAPSTDQALLRALLATADRGTPFRRPDDAADDARILALARHHRVSPLLAVGARSEGFAPGLAATFRQDRLSTLGRSTLLRHALGELLVAFDGQGIDVAVLKGISYEDLLYPDPGTRPSSDIDILVPQAARRTALRTLARLGFAPSASAPGFDQPDYHEVSFHRDAVNVDLHFGLAPVVRGSVDDAHLWDGMQTWNFEGRMTKTPSFLHAAVNQALHMAIHHFDVPGLYLLDFRRLVAKAGAPAGKPRPRPSGDELGRGLPDAGEVTAHTHARLRSAAAAWGFRRPLETTLALVTAFLGEGPAGTEAPAEPTSGWGWSSRRVVEGFGGLEPLARSEQLARKVLHFDRPRTAARYLWVQGRRILRERWLRRGARPRTAAERLGLDTDTDTDPQAAARRPPDPGGADAGGARPTSR